MTDPKSILPLVVDEKMELINAALPDGRVEIELPRRQSPRRFLQSLVVRLLRGNAPDALLVRYLNSPTPLPRALSWWLFTSATVVAARMAGVKVLWLVHNVDRETIQPYAALTRSLRWIVSRMSSSVLVTDPLLVDVAKSLLPAVRCKLDWITFGERTTSLDRLLDDIEDDETDEVVALAQQVRQQHPGALIGFCPTSAGDKFVHLRLAPDLVTACFEAGCPVHLLIVGPLEDYLRSNGAPLANAVANGNIHLVPRRIRYDPRRVGGHVDFYWRSLSDQSVSYTLYEAASVGLPVLTMKCGFLGTAVPAYRLGACLEMDFSNLRECLERLRGWQRENASVFLRTHSWSVAAARLSRLV